jgi:hypothetical protein
MESLHHLASMQHALHVLLLNCSAAGLYAAVSAVVRRNNPLLLTGGDVAHLLGLAGLLNSGHRVTATNDGDGALRSELSQGVSNGL